MGKSVGHCCGSRCVLVRITSPALFAGGYLFCLRGVRRECDRSGGEASSIGSAPCVGPAACSTETARAHAIVEAALVEYRGHVWGNAPTIFPRSDILVIAHLFRATPAPLRQPGTEVAELRWRVLPPQFAVNDSSLVDRTIRLHRRVERSRGTWDW